MRQWLSIVLVFVAACASRSGADWVEGGLYLVEAEGGGFSVVKILKLEDEGVHVRVYSNRFDVAPGEIDEGSLHVAGVNRDSGVPPGVGHLPLATDSFTAWTPRYVKTVSVDVSELDGYRQWKEEGGGYF
jgi:hypothetical protein